MLPTCPVLVIPLDLIALLTYGEEHTSDLRFPGRWAFRSSVLHRRMPVSLYQTSQCYILKVINLLSSRFQMSCSFFCCSDLSKDPSTSKTMYSITIHNKLGFTLSYRLYTDKKTLWWWWKSILRFWRIQPPSPQKEELVYGILSVCFTCVRLLVPERKITVYTH
jgi:hypothetical protein